jgi:enoyl-CoA hydratase/carnithine racemase
MVLGPNKGREFLWTGLEMGAEEARERGFVAEVVPHAALNARAWELARQLAVQPKLMLRYTRVSTAQHIKRRMLDDLGYGLQMEALAGMAGKSKSG